MGLQGSKPIPALNNHGPSADNKSLERPGEHLLEQGSSCGAGGDWWETRSPSCRCNEPRLAPGGWRWGRSERCKPKGVSVYGKISRSNCSALRGLFIDQELNYWVARVPVSHAG